MKPTLGPVARRAWALLIGSLVMACAAAVPSGATNAPSFVATASPSNAAANATGSNGTSSLPSASAEATESTFTSKIYGYSVAVPGGWSSNAAIARWDGVSGLDHDNRDADEWIRGTAVAWGSGAAYEQGLESYTAKTIADAVKYHGQDCTPPPQAVEAISVGGEPGTLISWNCGVLINMAVTVHNGIGYTFGFRDPRVHAATDPTDRANFTDLLKSLRFPD